MTADASARWPARRRWHDFRLRLLLHLLPARGATRVPPRRRNPKPQTPNPPCHDPLHQGLQPPEQKGPRVRCKLSSGRASCPTSMGDYSCWLLDGRQTLLISPKHFPVNVTASAQRACGRPRHNDDGPAQARRECEGSRLLQVLHRVLAGVFRRKGSSDLWHGAAENSAKQENERQGNTQKPVVASKPANLSAH